MAQKLAAAFQRAKDEGGFLAQVRLAMLTKMTLEKALKEPDTPENVKLFEECLVKLRAFSVPQK
jgi:hypothetical protein